jgi:hypothetical protein
MAEQAQNYKNHSRFPGSIVANSIFLILAAISAGAGVALFLNSDSEVPGIALIGVGALVCAITTVTVALMSRTYALTLQDRIIRLEMEVRFARLLPADLSNRARSLKIGQLVALRFASDEELVELVKRVLDQKIEDRAEIKKMVRNWQADRQRV